MNIAIDFLDPTIIWFIVGLIILLLELAVPGLILFFFGIGAWLVAILTLMFDLSINVQLFIFFTTSVVLLATLRKYVKKLFMGKMESSVSENESTGDLVGEKAIVIEPIIPPRNGKIELHGTRWNAEADFEIAAGETVEVSGKKNLTLKVKTLK